MVFFGVFVLILVVGGGAGGGGVSRAGAGLLDVLHATMVLA